MKSYELYKNFQDDVSEEEAHRRYRDYAEEYLKRSASNFFKTNKDKEWMREKYDPNLLSKFFPSFLEKVNNENQNFQREFEEGSLIVPPLDFDRFTSFYKEKMPEEYQSALEITEIEDFEEDSNTLDKVLNQDFNKNLENQVNLSYLAHPPHTLFISTIHPNCYKEEVFNFLNSVRDSPLVKLTLSRPLENKGWTRQAWASYQTKEQAENVLNQLNEKEIKPDCKIVLAHYTPKSRHFKQAHPVFSSLERIKKDVLNCQDLISKLDRIRNLYDEQNKNPLLHRNESQEEVDHLDLLIDYLRRVHFFCYYSLKEFNDLEELENHSGKYFLRAKPRNIEFHISQKVSSNFDSKFSRIIHYLKIPDLVTGKRAEDEAKDSFLRENFSEITDEKYKCKLCNKAFKAEIFIVKHLTTRHTDLLQKCVDKALEKVYYDNYMNDLDHPNTTPQISRPVPQQNNYNNSSSSKSNRNKNYVEEDDEDEVDPRSLIDYLEIDSSVQGVPPLDYYLGIVN